MKYERHRLPLYVFFSLILLFAIIIFAFTKYFSGYYVKSAKESLQAELDYIQEENQDYIDSGYQEIDNLQSELDQIYNKNADIWLEAQSDEDAYTESISYTALLENITDQSDEKMQELKADAEQMDEIEEKISALYDTSVDDSDEYEDTEEEEDPDVSIFDSAVSYIYLDDQDALDSQTEAGFSYTRTTKELVDYNEETPSEEGVIQRYKGSDFDYFYATAKSELYMGGQDIILYVNAYPVFNSIEKMTIIFVLIGVFFTCSMTFLFYCLGKKIDQSNETQKIFFQNASHELKTPLMSIQGYTEGIQTGILEPKSSADIIMEETERMTNLVQELLSLSKIDANQMKMKLEECDITEVLYDALRSFEMEFQKLNLQLNIDFEDEVLLKCDELQMRKVFTNLISNALRYAEQEIYISCKRVEKNVIVTIKDDGTDISAKDLEHVFERFYIGKNGKTGIGLSLSKEIVRLHKGKLKAFKQDNYTVFEVVL